MTAGFFLPRACDLGAASLDRKPKPSASENILQTQRLFQTVKRAERIHQARSRSVRDTLQQKEATARWTPVSARESRERQVWYLWRLSASSKTIKKPSVLWTLMPRIEIKSTETRKGDPGTCWARLLHDPWGCGRSPGSRWRGTEDALYKPQSNPWKGKIQNYCWQTNERSKVIKNTQSKRRQKKREKGPKDRWDKWRQKEEVDLSPDISLLQSRQMIPALQLKGQGCLIR